MSEEPEKQEWFREPTRREHRIAGILFIVFGVFFVMLFVVLSGWWFRWIIAGLGVYSVVHGVRHALDGAAEWMNVDKPEKEEEMRIELDGSRPRRWVGWTSWGVLLLGVAGVLGWVLGRFTGSPLLAVGLVVFMVSYMGVMAYWASRRGHG